MKLSHIKNKTETKSKIHDWIKIFGAREHNLKNIDVAIPKEALTVITGPSGSGKSSLALDLLYTEGQRRYMESLSSYARQFVGIPKKPAFDRIEGLCPSIAIEQKTMSSNPRSTVGTITEVYDYMRILFARIGKAHCPTCKIPISVQTTDAITSTLLEVFTGKQIEVLSPIVRNKKGEFVSELLQLVNAGVSRFIINGTLRKLRSLEDIKNLQLLKQYQHTIDACIDVIDISLDERSRVYEAIEKSFKYANGMCKITVDGKNHIYSSDRFCVSCTASIPELEPRLFSFNSPIGACTSCHGLGFSYAYASTLEGAYTVPCQFCKGMRLNALARAVTVAGQSIYQLSDMSIRSLLSFFKQIVLDATDSAIGQVLIQEIMSRLSFLDNVGLGYLTLNRSASSLSGGEGQRIRLATQIGSPLSGVLYVLDEPSIGLHQRDNDRLIATLHMLRDLGNTVLVVEHDTDTMRQSDYIIDMGPAAGIHGGTVTAVGTPSELSKNKNSLTGDFLSGRRSISLPKQLRLPKSFMTLHAVDTNNLKNMDVAFPLGVICGISGVSGSGKSTLIMQELVPAMKKELGGRGYTRSFSKKLMQTKEKLSGAESINHQVVIDQTPIGRTPRSNPATYLGIFDDIRKLYALLPESKARGYKEGRFSFNVAEGRCGTCRGEGQMTIEMHFLPALVMQCKACKGSRYNSETLSIKYKGKSIADVLQMSVYEAIEFFQAHPLLVKRLQLMADVGLDYIQLGQPSTTLSGGEAQRIKLVDELAKRGNATLYILDEPTTGLHSSDIEKLLLVLNRLVDKGNSMIIIEHNLDLLKTVDYLIDLGPEGGNEGGSIVAAGMPLEVAGVKESYTGHYLKEYLIQAD